MNSIRTNLETAEQTTKEWFKAIEEYGLIVPGKTEKQLNDEAVLLAKELFGIEDFWHKKIIRAGANTMLPYGANPQDVMIQEDDIVIVDFGPVVNGWEADVARSYVLGNDPKKLKMVADVANAWQWVNMWYGLHGKLTGAEFYHYITDLTKENGYTFGGEIAGHIVGPYPHEQLGDGDLGLDIHPDNHQDMFAKDPNGNDRNWILEIHFVDKENNIGAFFEQLLTRP